MMLRVLRPDPACSYRVIRLSFVITTALASFACGDDVEGSAPQGVAGTVTSFAGAAGKNTAPREGGSGAVSGTSSTETTSGGAPSGGNGAAYAGRGGATIEGGAPSSGGEANGGATNGGATSEGGVANGGVGATAGTSNAGSGGEAGSTQTPDALCTLEDGTTISYDYSRGISGEYAFELSLNCGLGGYLEPLVALDPVDLAGVDEFVGELTDWFRGSILGCKDPGSEAKPKTFSLLPRSQSGQMSRGDFRASVTLFMTILDRHDGLEDGFDADQKSKIEDRINAFSRATIKRNTRVLTKLSSALECLTGQVVSGGT